MKRLNLWGGILSAELSERMNLLTTQWRKYPLLFQVFLLLCLNLILTPSVQAATGGALSQGQTFWLIALIGVIFALALYLFAVIFQPERF